MTLFYTSLTRVHISHSCFGSVVDGLVHGFPLVLRHEFGRSHHHESFGLHHSFPYVIPITDNQQNNRRLKNDEKRQTAALCLSTIPAAAHFLLRHALYRKY